jgi:hypothetical protein
MTNVKRLLLAAVLCLSAALSAGADPAAAQGTGSAAPTPPGTPRGDTGGTISSGGTINSSGKLDPTGRPEFGTGGTINPDALPQVRDPVRTIKPKGLESSSPLAPGAGMPGMPQMESLQRENLTISK